MSTLDDAKNKAATTYNSAADYYDHPANTFWERYGRRTVERLQLAPDEHRERVREENLDFVRRESVRSLEANVVYAAACKT